MASEKVYILPCVSQSVDHSIMEQQNEEIAYLLLRHHLFMEELAALQEYINAYKEQPSLEEIHSPSPITHDNGTAKVAKSGTIGETEDGEPDASEHQPSNELSPSTSSPLKRVLKVLGGVVLFAVLFITGFYAVIEAYPSAVEASLVIPLCGSGIVTFLYFLLMFRRGSYDKAHPNIMVHQKGTDTLPAHKPSVRAGMMDSQEGSPSGTWTHEAPFKRNQHPDITLHRGDSQTGRHIPEADAFGGFNSPSPHHRGTIEEINSNKGEHFVRPVSNEIVLPIIPDEAHGLGKFCPLCKSRLWKGQVKQHGNEVMQMVKCRNINCEFQKKLVFNL